LSDDFQRVKDALNILTVIQNETALTMKGKFLEQCPFCGGHECFSIKEKEQGYHCFQCPEHGDVFTFLEKYHNLSRGEALVRAAAIAGIELEKQGQGARVKGQGDREKRESTTEKIYRLAAEHYHQAALPEDSPARAWFCGHYKKDEAGKVIARGHAYNTLLKMRVGWSDAKITAILKEQGLSEEEILSSGIAVDHNSKDEPIPLRDSFWKAGVCVFPVVDHAGVIKSFTAKDPAKEMKNTQLKGSKKEWFINHSALGAFHDAITVEGENDVASVIDAGIGGVHGTAGQPSKEQIQLLANHYSNQTHYLWFDQDAQVGFKTDAERVRGKGGASHIRTIYKGLSGEDVTVRIITHPSGAAGTDGFRKDPDDYIQGLFAEGKSPAEVKSAIRQLMAKATDPLTWELQQLANEEGGASERLSLFDKRELGRAINKVVGMAEKEILITLAARCVGISVGSMEERVVKSSDLLHHLIEQYDSEYAIKKADGHQLAETIYKWFNNGAGAKFFKTKEGKAYLFFNRRQYEIGRNVEFNALMCQLTKLTAIEKPGNLVWDYLLSFCILHGAQVDMMSWIHTDRTTDTIYINLNSEHSKIVRIEPGKEPHMIENGTNEKSVLLSSSSQIQPFEYLQNTSEAEGFTRLKTLLMDTTPADIAQKYFLLGWTISIFMMHYQSDRGLMQVIGGSGLGKSKVAERVSQLLYGAPYVGKGTGASETRVATNNPIVFLDNLENRNLILATVDFLLFLANSANKPKAKAGSDTEVLYQKLNAFGMCTGIEPFPGKYPELINRTWPLILEPKYKSSGYMHDATMGEIRKDRDMMLSAIFKTLAMKVLPKLDPKQASGDRRRFWSQYLQTAHPGHNKERNNEHLCTIIVIIEAALEYLPIDAKMPIEKQMMGLVDKWVNYHEDQAKQSELTSNTLVNLMDGLAQEIVVKIRGQKEPNQINYQEHPEFEFRKIPGWPEDKKVEVKVFHDPEYITTFYLTRPYKAPKNDEDVDSWLDDDQVQRLEFILTAGELHTLFNRYCKNQGNKNPYDNPTSLGSRAACDKKVMAMAGWEYVQGDNPEKLTYKRKGGYDHWRFSKVINAIRE
jgi:DNA primase